MGAATRARGDVTALLDHRQGCLTSPIAGSVGFGPVATGTRGAYPSQQVDHSPPQLRRRILTGSGSCHGLPERALELEVWIAVRADLEVFAHLVRGNAIELPVQKFLYHGHRFTAGDAVPTSAP